MLRCEVILWLKSFSFCTHISTFLPWLPRKTVQALLKGALDRAGIIWVTKKAVWQRHSMYVFNPYSSPEIRFYFFWEWGFSIDPNKDSSPKNPFLLRFNPGSSDSAAANSYLEISQLLTWFGVFPENDGQKPTLQLHLRAPQNPGFPAFSVLSVYDFRELLLELSCKSGTFICIKFLQWKVMTFLLEVGAQSCWGIVAKSVSLGPVPIFINCFLW